MSKVQTLSFDGLEVKLNTPHDKTKRSKTPSNVNTDDQKVPPSQGKSDTRKPRKPRSEDKLSLSYTGPKSEPDSADADGDVEMTSPKSKSKSPSTSKPKKAKGPRPESANDPTKDSNASKATSASGGPKQGKKGKKRGDAAAVVKAEDDAIRLDGDGADATEDSKQIADGDAGAAATESKTRKRKRLQVAAEKYQRGEGVATKNIQDKKLRRKLVTNEKRVKVGVDVAARAEILLPSEAGFLQAENMERTWRFTQEQLKPHLDERTREKMFDLNLPVLGPYNMDFTRNGRHLLLGGRKGHLAIMDWSHQKLVTELNVNETVRDVKFLHNESMFAVAQKKGVFIYDSGGIELHALRWHLDPTRLEFLPHHFLLVSVGKTGWLKYQDTSTGAKVMELRTRLGDCDVMTQNPHNAVVLLGHTNGQVTMWTPNLSAPVVKMFTHNGPVQALAVDQSGHYMVSSGLDGQTKVWDVRTYKQLHSYYSVRPASTISISQTGLFALGFGPHVQIWKDAIATKAQSPYMVQNYNGKLIRDVQFCPFEDVLGVSHSHGYSSMVVPGSGEPNFDTFSANPYETYKQKREATVVSLLEKLQPSMITLDTSVIGSIDKAAPEVIAAEKKEEEDQKKEEAGPEKEKNKMRGKSKSSKRWRRKRTNVIDQKLVEHRQKVDKAEKERRKQKEEEQRAATGQPKSALERFGKKG